MSFPHPRLEPQPGRAWLVLLLLVGPLALSGCTSDEAAPDPGASLNVVIEEPEDRAIVGEPLELTLQTTGEGAGPDRLGLAWANASTANIDDHLLLEAAFDEVLWTPGTASLPAEWTLTIDRVPDDLFLFVRGVVERDDRKTWGDEMRLVITPPQPPLEQEVRLKNLPQETYWSNLHALRIETTGDDAEASQIGFSWSHTPTTDRHLESLRPERFEGSHTLNGSSLLPDEFRLPPWRVPTDSELHLRAWVLVDGAYHWSRGYTLYVTDPPLYDHKATKTDHTIVLDPSPLPLPHLDAFTPQELHIKRGESVRWLNQAESVHSASRDENNTSFHTGNLGPGASSETFRFLVPGEYSYRCRLHPEAMEAVLVVTE